MADEVSSWEMRDGGEMDISEHHQCYVYGQCQELSVDFSYQEDAEGCHSFCGKLDGCNWWSWEPEQSLCIAFDDCTASGGPDGHICPDCITGEKLKWFLSLTRFHFQPPVTEGHVWLRH